MRLTARDYVSANIFLRRDESLRKIVLSGSVFIFLFLIIISCQSLFAQWKKIASFPFTPGIVFFQNNQGHPEIGFVGTWIINPQGATNFPSELWKTTDGGVTWRNVADLRWIGAVRNIFFKDAMNGWATIAFTSGTETGCYRTRDGGETWNPLNGTSGNLGSSVYYNSSTNLLFVNFWWINFAGAVPLLLLSSDEGMTWQSVPNSYNGDGFVFWDSQHGLEARVAPWPTTIYLPFLITSDGGFTWQESSLKEECWQPLAITGTSMGFALCEQTNKLYRTWDYGATWTLIHQFDPTIGVAGCIAGNLNKLYAHTAQGVFTSVDSGMSWTLICGSPSCSIDTRFQVFGDSLYVCEPIANKGGNLWLNISGNGSGPRLQIEKGNIVRHTIVKSRDIFPENIFYPKDAYTEPVDSLTFTMTYSDPLIFIRDSVATGWDEIRRVVTDTNIAFVLKRTDSNPPQTDSFLLRTYFQAVIAKETSASLTLDEINFNQDTTFHDCMIAALSKTDSFFVDITDQCGDSILRQFITTGKVLEITSIRPNPAQDELEIDLRSALKQDATIEIFDALGVRVFSDVRNVASGANTIHLDTRGLSSGVYLVRVGSASQSFVKMK